MGKTVRRKSKKAGLQPGTLIHVGIKKEDQARIRIIDFTEKDLYEEEVKNIGDCFPFRDTASMTWINVDGLHDVEIVEAIGKHFNVHSLVLEDIVETGQRPKIEDYGKYLFVVANMLKLAGGAKRIDPEQFSMLVGSNFVLTFQERVGDVFEPLRERLRKGRGRVRKSGSDYLAYCLLDAIVDNYFLVLETVTDRVEVIEESVTSEPSSELLKEIFHLKRELISIRKHIWPLREVVGALERGEPELIGDSVTNYLRDLYDHTIQVIDTVEMLRDTLSGVMDLYMTMVSNRMNEVMKMLTIIATIFIPLTFLAGIYGMNFEWMPELKWRYGYPAALGLMGIVVVGLVVYFKKRKWL